MSAHVAAATHQNYSFELAHQRLARQDQETSDDLSRRLGLRSWREAHPEEQAPGNPCQCGCDVPVPINSPTPYATELCRRRVQMRMTRAREDMRNGVRVGERIGNLTVLARLQTRGPRGVRLCQARCDCGRELVVPGMALRRGQKTMCAACSRAGG